MELKAFDRSARRAALRVLEYNPYHGKDGRFTGKSGAASSVAYAGKRPEGMGKGKAAIRRETGADAEMKRTFPNGPTSRSFQASSGGKNRQHGRAAALYGEARRLRQAGDAAGSKAAANAAGRERYAASGNESVRRPQRNDYREQVPQDLKKYTRRGSSGKRTGPGELSRVPGESVLLGQDRLLTSGGKVGGKPYQGGISSRTKQMHHAAAAASYGRARGVKNPAIRASDRALADRYRAHAAKLGGGETRERVPQSPGKHVRPSVDGTPGDIERIKRTEAARRSPVRRDGRPDRNDTFPLERQDRGSVRGGVVLGSRTPTTDRQQTRRDHAWAAEYYGQARGYKGRNRKATLGLAKLHAGKARQKTP